MSTLPVVVVMGADDARLVAEAEAATDRWEEASRAGIGRAAEQRAYAESDRLAAELDAAADARAVDGILSDEHLTSSYGLPVVLIEGRSYGPADLAVGSRVQAEPSGTLRHWLPGGPVPASTEEAAAAMVDGRATVGEYSRFNHEEHDLVTRARRAGYSVVEGIAHRPADQTGRRPR